MFDWRSPTEWTRIRRYYQAGIVNTLFGYGLFALLVWLSMNVYLAQTLSHLSGMAFNYFTYSRYAFAGHEFSPVRFILSYGVNYLLGLAALAGFTQIVASPYVAGMASVIVVSLINYFILKKFVYRRPDPA